jgi:Transposase, Mutator family
LTTTLSRRPKTRKQRQVNDRQRRRRQRQLQSTIDAALGRIVRANIEAALQGEVTLLLGRPKNARRDRTDPTVVRARCNKCGTELRRQFSRAGFYPRSILTFTTWSPLAVPRVSCVCGGMVDVEFEHLVPYGRLWFDLEERARELAGLCVSLRDSVAVLAWLNRQPLGIATINRRVNETARLAESFHRAALGRIPAVVMLDGLWVKILQPTGEEFTDRQGRRRQRHRRRAFPILVAFGIDPVSGERWILDWERGQEEDAVSWTKLLERLEERGLRAETGFQLFVHDGSAGLEAAFAAVDFGPGVAHQRCIFHKLQNVRRDIQGTPAMDRHQRREHGKAVLTDAAAVYQGTDDPQMRQRLVDFRVKWGASEPKAVATLERDFDRTIAYLPVQEEARRRGELWKTECLRATSALERVQRHLRQKARQVVIFHAEAGVDAAVYLVIAHHNLVTPAALPWARQLEDALLAA